MGDGARRRRHSGDIQATRAQRVARERGQTGPPPIEYNSTMHRGLRVRGAGVEVSNDGLPRYRRLRPPASRGRRSRGDGRAVWEVRKSRERRGSVLQWSRPDIYSRETRALLTTPCLTVVVVADQAV